MSDDDATADGREAERALMAAGDGSLVHRARAEADAFAAERTTALATLADDVLGDFRQGGAIRLLTILLLLPMGLPSGVHVVRNLAGQGLEWLGFCTSVLCVVLVATSATLVRGRALDGTTLSIVGFATASVVAGAGLTWWILGSHWLTVGASACGLAMLLLLALLVAWRLRDGTAGRLRDREAMDRARTLRLDLRERLAPLMPSGSRTTARERFVDELVARVVPMPRQRVLADARMREQRAAGEGSEPGSRS